MTYSPVHPDSAEWDQFVVSRRASLLQLSSWGALKSKFGWRHEMIGLEMNSTIVAGALVLYRSLPLGLGSIAYIPKGPVVDWNDRAAAGALIAAIDSAARVNRVAFVKVEPDMQDSTSSRQTIEQYGFRVSKQAIQPPNTIIIDIDGTDEQILSRMNQGTRRKIRTAAKDAISVRRGSIDEISVFNHLAQVTGKRDGFGVHSLDYYRTAFELFAPDRAVLLLASYEDKDIAGLMAFASVDLALYLYGASGGEHRERMPNYLLQWEAIRWARERGCKRYDLWGIPDVPTPELEAKFQSRRDGLWGVYGFKRGFGGEIFRSVGAWDRVYNPVVYAAYQAVMHSRD